MVDHMTPLSDSDMNTTSPENITSNNTLIEDTSINITESTTNTNQTDEYLLHLLTAQKLNDYVNCGFIFLLVPFVLGGNILTILSVMKFRPLQTVMNTYIVSLAFADLMVGFPTIPLYIAFFLWEKIHYVKYVCLLKYFFVLIGLPASILNLLIVTIDRFVAIRCPLRYNSMMTKRKAKCLISLVWLYSIGSACLPLLGLNTWESGMPCDFWLILPKPFTMVTVTGIMVTSLPSMVIMYLMIFREIRSSTKRMAKYKSKGNVNPMALRRDSRRAKLMFCVFLTFIIFWFPFCMISVLKYTDIHPIIIEMIKVCAVSLTMSNSMINPIIYCWIRPDFRSAFKSLIGIRKSDELSLSDMNCSQRDVRRGESAKGSNCISTLS